MWYWKATLFEKTFYSGNLYIYLVYIGSSHTHTHTITLFYVFLDNILEFLSLFMYVKYIAFVSIQLALKVNKISTFYKCIIY